MCLQTRERKAVIVGRKTHDQQHISGVGKKYDTFQGILMQVQPATTPALGRFRRLPTIIGWLLPATCALTLVTST
jgi:hypothetical protein